MSSESVKVIVRCRPLNKREKDLKCKVIVQIDSSLGQCAIINPADTSGYAKPFTFDGAYFTESTTEQIYNEIVFPIVESVTEGYNGTVFAYGQTGCGKSFTMQGVASPVSQRGIIPRSFEHIFEAIATTSNTKFLVHASYLEIYNEEIRDLLGEDTRKKLELKENADQGVYVAGLSMHTIHNVQQCEKIMAKGWQNRSVGATMMNADSSRSHSIFTVHLERMQTDCEQGGDNCTIRKGKLNLVDLAGSERQAKTGATGDRLKEATKINLSLSALGNVISALVDGKSKHIPYRDSKLTRLLQDSLGGNTKTLMVACLSPADNNYDETLSTLRYANRAKNIKNAPKINEDPKDALLRQYQEEIQRLKNMLNTSPIAQIKTEDDDVVDKLKAEYERQMKDLVEKHREEQERNAQLKSDMMKLQQTFTNNNNNNNENSKDTKKIDNNADGGEITQLNVINRLQSLQENMVGGEKADDAELVEKRSKRKILAEKRKNAITEALKKVDEDDQLLIKAYGDISEELRARTIVLKRAKKKVAALEREVSDLQSEFETERTDYLETIRRQDQQIKLMSQILDKIQPCIRKDCNYSNIDRIKTDSFWDEDQQRWRLPELIIQPIKLPPPADNGKNNAVHNRQSMSVNGNLTKDNNKSPVLNGDETIGEVRLATQNEDRLFQKLEKNTNDNLAVSYFGPRRSEQLLSNAIKHSKLKDSRRDFGSDGHLTAPLINGINENSHINRINTINIDNAPISPLNRQMMNQTSKSLPSTSNRKVANGFFNINSMTSAEITRRPIRLQSIHAITK